jgi:hypothetical protein
MRIGPGEGYGLTVLAILSSSFMTGADGVLKPLSHL